MQLLNLEFWVKHQRALGIIAIVIGAGAWASELAGMVYICPYCRVQRSVILLLGILMLLPQPQHWITRYIGFTLGFLGAVVAVNQNFMGWARISKGEFILGEPWFLNPFLMSGAALFIIVAQVWLIAFSRPAPPDPRADD